jgi:hypothetical protein
MNLERKIMNKRKLDHHEYNDDDCIIETNKSKFKANFNDLNNDCIEKTSQKNCKYYLSKLHQIKNADLINSNIHSVSLNGNYIKSNQLK